MQTSKNAVLITGGATGVGVFLALSIALSCGHDEPTGTMPGQRCTQSAHTREDAHTPESVVYDWGPPVRLGSPVNTPCPEDAIEISADGQYLYYLFTHDVIDGNSTADEIFAPGNGTYRATRSGGPDQFDQEVFYDLGKGADPSLDGEPSFTPDGRRVYFHSNRLANTGYQHDPFISDYQDIYVADLTGGEPGPGQNLGAPVNSVYPDGEHAIHPDGTTLYFTSSRPGGFGGNDIWVSTSDGVSWSDPVNLGTPINSSGSELQPTFTSDGNTMYFTSDRDPSAGVAIFRSARVGGSWGEPELVLKGNVGETSLTADGRYLYFVHVLQDQVGIFDADVWYCEQMPR